MRTFPLSRPARIAAALAGLCWSMTGLAAQSVPDPNNSQTLSLTDAQKAELLSHNTETSVDAARSGLGGGGPGRQVHGEIGVAVGTHGAREAYGTAAIPLGDSAQANVSFESSRYGRGR